MDLNKFLEMKPMKYVGGTSAKARVQRFLNSDAEYQNWLYSTKVDGEWARIVYGLDGSVTIQGRGISTVTKKHKDNTESLPHLVEEVKKNWAPGTVAIGELSFEDHENHVQKEVGSVLRSLPARALKLQENSPLHFYAFDMLAFNGEDLSGEVYSKRLENISSLSTVDSKYVVVLKQFKVKDGALEHLDSILSAGGEGIMIMNPKGKYLPGSRSVTSSLKIKKEMNEITVVVTNTVAPQIAYRGSEGDTWEYKDEEGNNVTKYHALGWKAGIEFDYKGTRVKAVSGTSDEDAKWLATPEAQEMIANGDLRADITAMEELVTDGVPNLRHPVLLKLRTDL